MRMSQIKKAIAKLPKQTREDQDEYGIQELEDDRSFEFDVDIRTFDQNLPF